MELTDIPIDKWVGVILVIYAVTLHELGHAYVATWCGDPTPGRHGRLTFNPLVQLHPIYSVLMPILTYFTMGFPFGWAFCPIDPSRFRKPLRDRALTALAGPTVNFFLTGIGIGMMWLMWWATENSDSLSFSVFFGWALWNLLLGVFNLFPLPGLDGYDVIRPAIPLSVRRPLDAFRSMGFLPFVVSLLLASQLFTSLLIPLLVFYLSLLPQDIEALKLLEQWFKK